MCVLFFIVNEGLFKDYVNIPVMCMNAILFALWYHITITERSNGDPFKNQVKEHSGYGNFLFLYYFLLLQLFFNPLFFAFVQQLTAGDSAGRRRILTTLLVAEEEC